MCVCVQWKGRGVHINREVIGVYVQWNGRGKRSGIYQQRSDREVFMLSYLAALTLVKRCRLTVDVSK